MWRLGNAVPIYRRNTFQPPAERQLVRRPGNVIGTPFLIWIQPIALPERPLCSLRRAGARYAGVVRRLVMLIARCATCGTKARYADCSLWEK
jgi:hypothetical protein